MGRDGTRRYGTHTQSQLVARARFLTCPQTTQKWVVTPKASMGTRSYDQTTPLHYLHRKIGLEASTDGARSSAPFVAVRGVWSVMDSGRESFIVLIRNERAERH